MWRGIPSFDPELVSSDPDANYAQHLLNAVGGTSKDSGAQEDDNFGPNEDSGAPNDGAAAPNDDGPLNDDGSLNDDGPLNDDGAPNDDGTEENFGLNYAAFDDEQFNSGFTGNDADVDMQEFGLGDDPAMDLDIAVSTGSVCPSEAS